MLLILLAGKAGGMRRKLGRGACPSGRQNHGQNGWNHSTTKFAVKRGAPVLNMALGAGVRPFELNELGSHCGEGRAALGGSRMCHATYCVKLETMASDVVDGLRCQFVVFRPAPGTCVH